ncbi:MAG: hypothetical protein ACLGPL_04155 [Acidobacteriota bacterium]
MTEDRNDECVHDGETYDHGSQMCTDQSCYICAHGEWEEYVGVYPSPKDVQAPD